MMLGGVRLRVLFLLVPAVWSCRQSGEPPAGEDAPPAPAAEAPEDGTTPPTEGSAAEEPAATGQAIFTDVTEESGLHFVHFTGATGEYYFAEIKGPGCGLFDYDNDGDLDVYALQGTLLAPGGKPEDGLEPYEGVWPPRNRLFRNDLSINAAGERRLSFTDVTEQAGVGHTDYGMGCAAGDYDNDGDLDLYVTNLRANVLYRNRGDGTFEEVTEQAGVGEDRWSSNASFLDVDQDGYLDLFVVNYVNFSPENNKPCFGDDSGKDYCGPKAYDAVPDRLFHNNGDGTFSDVTIAAGINLAIGAGIGICSADFNNDGHLDIYVTNDAWPNQLWINRGDGTFEDLGLLGGAALNEYGVTEAGMGVMADDFDLDGDEDIIIAHLREESDTLYLNEGGGMFIDATTQMGLSGPSRPHTSFGAAWLDYDNDGLLDLFFTNGDVKRGKPGGTYWDPYRLPNQLLRNTGRGRFIDISEQAGPAVLQAEVSRGAAFGDVDNDGDTDVLFTNLNGRMRLLRNDVGQEQNWVTLRLLDGGGARDAIGAWVGLVREGQPTLWRRVRTDGSCYSTNDPRVHFGLGGDSGADEVVVHWPGGLVESWSGVPVNTISTLRQGQGR